MLKIGIINNPHARMNRAYPGIKDKMQRIIGDSGIVRETKCAEEIPEIAKEFLREGIEVLGISGGDGTLHSVVTAFFITNGHKKLPLLLPLRRGTMNTISNSLKIKGNTERLLNNIINKHRRQEELGLFEQQTIKVNNKYGFIFGNGLVVNFLNAYYQGNTTGPLKAMEVVARLVTSTMLRTGYSRRLFDHFNAEIIVDGQKVPFTEYFTVLSSTVREVGLGFSPMYRAYEREGYLPFIILSRINPIRILPKIPRIYLGKPLKMSQVYESIGREIIIRSEKPPSYTIDGDIFPGEQEMRISVGPRVNFVR